MTAAKLTPSEDFLAWATGITTGTVTSSFLFVFGPVVGYYTGRLVHKKTVVRTVKERLGQEGDLRSVLRRWNRDTFEEKGFQAWLELPLDPGELHEEYAIDETLDDKTPKAQKKAAKKAARRFRIIITPSDDPVSTTVESASDVPAPNIPPLAEATTNENRTPQELHDTVSEPPPYSAAYSPAYSPASSPAYSSENTPEKDRQGQNQPQPSRSVPNEVAELYSVDAETVQYIQPAGPTNS